MHHINCSSLFSLPLSFSECASSRNPKMYECDNRQCIDSVDMQCDGKKQCKDGSDEAYCKTREAFKHIW